MGYGGLDVGRGRVDAFVQIELERERSLALRAFRGHDFEPIDLHELPLEGRGDGVRHDFGAGARIRGLHLNDRIVNRGEVVHRQSQEAHDAEENDRDRKHRGHDGAANERFGEVHGFPASPPASLGSSTFTLPPGMMPMWPMVTTRSPALRPLSITTRSSCRCPSVTGRSSAVESSFTT